MRNAIWLQTPSVLTRKNYFSHLLNVDEDNDVRQIKIHTAEPPEPQHSAFEVEIVTAVLKGANQQVVIKFQQN
jgi:hypothetical protein